MNPVNYSTDLKNNDEIGAGADGETDYQILIASFLHK
jgi:hypothetical protein